MSEARAGISGWRYAPWRGDFYPAGLPQRVELEYASTKLRTIEINGSFYSLQRESSWRLWRDTVPDDFVFSVKGGRYITHMLKLKNAEKPLERFFAQGVFDLGPKLGPILWQLPPVMQFDPDVVDSFLRLLPRAAPSGVRLRHAVEVRNSTFESPDFLALLDAHGVASVIADTAGTFPVIEHVSSDLVYIRLHGDTELYASGYDAPALDHWAERVRGWRDEGRDVFVYFDNDMKVRAPYDAMGLAARL
jgi:uncharacterized protein YecE (DUF72 family)